MREALWFVWQQPRLGRCIRGKYPVDRLWTSAARAAYAADSRRCELEIEHVEPIRQLIDRLLTSPLDDEAVVAMLSDSLRFCVVTPNGHRKLAHSPTDVTDIWTRYREAGIDVALLGPLFQRPGPSKPTL